MNILGIIGIALGLAAIVYFSAKGLNTIIGAPLATIIVILANKLPLFDALIGSQDSYIVFLANFLISNFAIFLLGSILAKYMEKSGATVSIADKILSVIGTDKPYSVLLALFIISSLLTLGGISMFVVCFALIPMAKPLFKKLNIAWNLVTIPIFAGMATFTMSMFPGTPAMSNVIPSTALGTPLTAAPIIGVVTSIIAITLALIYMKYELNRSLKKNEKYTDFFNDSESQEAATNGSLPSFLTSIIPVLGLILVIIIFSKVANIVVIALAFSILLSAVLFRKQVPAQIKILNEGALGAITPAVTTGSTVAFGSLLSSAPAFLVIKNLILGIPGNPLISLSVATVLLSGITGSSVGSIGIAMGSFAQTYIDMGINPEIVHRISSIASGAFGVMPHTGLVITFNAIASLNLKKSYKYQFVTVNVIHAISLVVAIVLATFMG